MLGKQYDTRVYPHFTKVYSKVPYLDTQIFNIQVQGLRQSRRTKARTQRVVSGLERARQKSDKLEQGLRTSRLRQIQNDKNFIEELKESQHGCLLKQRKAWDNFSTEKRQSRIDNVRDQKYLEGLLATNSTKAASRLTSVRRWH